MPYGQEVITCQHCGRATVYSDMASPPLICPHCFESLQPMRSPDLVLLNAEKPAPPAPVPSPTAGLSSRQSKKQIALLAVMILVTVGGILFMIIDYLDKQDRYQRLMNNGRTVYATITNLRIGSSEDGTYYAIQYRFQPVEDTQRPAIADGTGITKELYSSLKVGQLIEVIYEVSNPNNHSIKSELQPPDGSLIWYVVLILALDGGVVIFFISYPYAKSKSRTAD